MLPGLLIVDPVFTAFLLPGLPSCKTQPELNPRIWSVYSKGVHIQQQQLLVSHDPQDQRVSALHTLENDRCKWAYNIYFGSKHTQQWAAI
jgi:hypothetical protein